MLESDEEPGLPVIVQIVMDNQSPGVLAVLVPASNINNRGSTIDLRTVETAQWAGPVEPPPVTR